MERNYNTNLNGTLTSFALGGQVTYVTFEKTIDLLAAGVFSLTLIVALRADSTSFAASLEAARTLPMNAFSCFTETAKNDQVLSIHTYIKDESLYGISTSWTRN